MKILIVGINEDEYVAFPKGSVYAVSDVDVVIGVTYELGELKSEVLKDRNYEVELVTLDS